jgi:peptidoglycan/LPS O-acetylase OafA/YrhL
MKENTQKLDQLTSLRFFAALMIVIHHSIDLFGITSVGVNLGQGVSFFFVLSGFILTYVYPKLGTWPEVMQFWRARIARIWPAYFASFLLGFWLVSYNWHTETAAANLLMVQGWIPLSTYYFSYNAVSWSVSTEMFFYLAFPFLIRSLNKRWWIMLILSCVILGLLVALSNFLSLPDYGHPAIADHGLLVTQHGLIYINPLSRIFEFIFGMCIALAWRKRQKSASPSVLIATSYELGVVILCALSMYYMSVIAAWVGKSILGPPAALWLNHSGSVFVFGLLIYIMAQGYGKITTILAHPFLVLLGEISFSLYLLHQILLIYYRANISELTQLSNSVAFGLFFSILLLSSYLMWTCIEMPGRRIILGSRKIHGTAVMKQSWRANLTLSRKTLFAGLALICIIGFIYFTIGKA